MPEWNEEIRQRLADLKLAPTREAEIIEELAQHLDDRYQELLGAGLSEPEALRAALAEVSENEPWLREIERVERPGARRFIEEPITIGARRGNIVANLWIGILMPSSSLVDLANIDLSRLLRSGKRAPKIL